MGAHNDTANDYQLFNTGQQTIADPGSGGTFNLRGIDRGIATIASGTRKLPNNIPLGVSLTVYATGSVTITTQAPVTMATLTAGQVATFTSRTSTTWNVTIHSTTGALSLNSAVTTLTTSYGFVPIPLTQWREVVSNDTAALGTAGATGSGGILATDTTPALEYINGDTNSTLRLRWAASNSDPLVCHVMIPADLDETQPIYFKAVGLMSGATNTPVLSLDTYFTELTAGGQAKVEDDTSAFSSAADVVTATIAASDFSALVNNNTPLFATIEITPGAHTPDILDIYATYLQYTKTLLTA